MLYLDGNPYLSFQLAYTGSAASENEFNRSLVLDFVTSAKFFYLGLGSFWGSADARFDDLMIYNRALSADDVKGLSTLLNRINPFNDGTIVGVEQLPSSDAPAIPLAQQGVYDLTGRKVAQPDKGLYIVDGKKVWFK
jgi:arabinan endo-1,5-alpha-L-arabinosidase